MSVAVFRPLPGWFKQELPDTRTRELSRLLGEASVHSVCQEAKCPNASDCFKRSEVTFLILGDVCTRNCRFCNIGTVLRQRRHCERSWPKPRAKRGGKQSQRRDCFFGLRPHRNDKRLLEPTRISKVVKRLGLRYVVITSVTRDDLADGGAAEFARTIRQVKARCPDIRVEALIPDFQGRRSSLALVLAAGPFLVGHNLETVARLYPEVRPQADYPRSLEVLRRLKQLDPAVVTKSSLMLGLGEEENEVLRTMRDIQDQGCDILVLGQYLAPSVGHYPVKEFLLPEKFAFYRERALALGFK